MCAFSNYHLQLEFMISLLVLQDKHDLHPVLYFEFLGGTFQEGKQHFLLSFWLPTVF